MTVISTDATVITNTGKTYRTWFGYGGKDTYANNFYIAQGIITPSNSEFNYNNRGALNYSDIAMFFHVLSSAENSDEKVSFILPKAHMGDIFIAMLSDNITLTQCKFTTKIYDENGKVADSYEQTVGTGKSASFLLQYSKKPNSPKIRIDVSVSDLFTKEKLPVSISINEEK